MLLYRMRMMDMIQTRYYIDDGGELANFVQGGRGSPVVRPQKVSVYNRYNGLVVSGYMGIYCHICIRIASPQPPPGGAKPSNSRSEFFSSKLSTQVR